MYVPIRRGLGEGGVYEVENMGDTKNVNTEKGKTSTRLKEKQIPEQSAFYDMMGPSAG